MSHSIEKHLILGVANFNKRGFLCVVKYQGIIACKMHLPNELIIHNSLLPDARLSKQLTDVERRHHMHCCWTSEDEEYLKIKHTFSLQKRQQIGEAMWASSVQRQFLLKLKAKYAGK